MAREGAYPVLFASEQKILKIKAETDRFEQKLNQVVNGYATDKFLSDECHNLMLSIRDLSAELANIQKMSEQSDEDTHLRARAHNLSNQAITQMRRIQNIGVRVQQYLHRPTTQATEPNTQQFVSPLEDFSTPASQQQQQHQLPPDQLQLDDQLAHDMERLESDLVQVNEIFTALATCVHDQGILVDSIDKNVEVAYEQVEAGTKHLESAVKHKKSSRRKKCICLLLVLVFLTIIGLIIGLSVRN